MHKSTQPLLTFPGKRTEEIENLKQVKSLLNGCSDDLTQIHTPGPIEYLEEESMTKVYVFIVIIWINMILICCYGVCNGIIAHIWFCLNKSSRFKNWADDKDVDSSIGG